MIFRRFPYTTLNDINLDWIIKQVKQIAAALQGKQDKPDAAGVAGQVLGLDENLDPVWLDNGGGGGGGGTTNYNNLTNKPQINSVTLSGNKTAADLGLANASDIPTVPVQSVNGQTGAVELDAADVGALPSNTFIPGYSLQLPVMDGEASAGTNFSRFAMEGHRHPTDTSRASAAELATFMRPNLLDNWYFVGGGSQLGYGTFPINQRGQTVYSTSGAYTIDRWKLNTSGTVAVGADGFTFESTGGWQSLRQYLSSYKSLSGKPVTISALVSTEAQQNLYMALQYQSGGSEHDVCYQTSNTSDLRLVTVSATAPDLSDATQAYFRIGNVSGATTSPIKIIAVKLEIGSTQTLAHQENGAWVLNEVPDYATELAKCQAYLLPISALSRTRTNIVLDNVLGFDVPVPVTMAKTPAIVGTLRVSTLTGSFVTGFTFDVGGISDNAVRIRASKTSHGLTDGIIDSDSTWYLSAE